jgi:hypothetical protein
MSGKSSSGGTVGSAAAAVSASFVDDYNPVVMLFKQFSATGATAAVSVPSGVGKVDLNFATTGAPTAVAVKAEGSNDGNSWTTLPSGNQSPGDARYTKVRLNLSVLNGGTTPTVTVAALCTP